MNRISRRATLATGLAAATAIATSTTRAQSVPEIRIARQFSLGYLQFNVMQGDKLIEKHASALGVPAVRVTWATFNGPDAMDTALISDSVDIVAGGVPGLLTIWGKTRGTSHEVKGISALSSQPFLLNTRDPAVKGIEDFTSADKIALPAVKVSVQAVVLEMAAAKRWGAADYAKLDPLTVSMSPPDATVALLGGGAGITSAFSVPPFQQQQLKNPAIHTVLNWYEVLGGPHSFTLAWTSARFRAGNPKLYQALLNALAEASEAVAHDPRRAAELWKADVHSTLDTDFVVDIVAGKQVVWTMAPQNTMKFATFMADVGSIKTRPASWQDYFFDEAHGLSGS